MHEKCSQNNLKFQYSFTGTLKEEGKYINPKFTVAHFCTAKLHFSLISKPAKCQKLVLQIGIWAWFQEVSFITLKVSLMVLLVALKVQVKIW